MTCARLSVVALLAALPIAPVSAEITLDGTMGPAGPLAGPNFAITDTLGTTQGANLFHSFSVFNIDSTESATFTGPAGLDNVISRVTGGTASSIDGLFRSTVPGADVYFINPAGVVFGQNATLDVQGAFHTSTADELRFTDGNVFSASNPPATILTAAAPAAFGFLGGNPAGITLNDSALEMPVGAALSLVGGDITIVGSDLNRPTPHVLAPGGRLNLVSVDDTGGVTKAGEMLDAGGFESHGDITVADSRLIVSGMPGGSVYIEGGNVVIDSSNIRSKSFGPLNGGDITIKGDSLIMSHEEARVPGSQGGGLQPRIRTVSYDSGDGGAVDIQASELILDGGIRLQTGTEGSGRGGDINIVVERFEALETGRISAWTWVNASGPGGNITIDAETIRMSDPGPPRFKTGVIADTYGDGPGGDVTIRADSIFLEERGFIDTRTEAATGNAGNITVEANVVEIRNGSGIQSINLFGSGDSGNVEVIADRVLVTTEGEPDFTQLNTFTWFGDGDSGDLTVRASTLEIREGLVGSSNLGFGAGGETRIYVDSLLLDGKGVVTPVFGDPDLVQNPLRYTTLGADSLISTGGPAGNVEIVADSVIVRGGAAIMSGTTGDSPGGSIQITANLIQVETEARIDSTTLGAGPAGSIILNVTDLILSESGRMTAASTASGLAGDVTVNATNSIRISDSFVSTEALASDGGNITLNAVTMLDLLNSSVTTSVGSGNGAGGNISIDPKFVIVQNSNIIANAFGGPGGNINIVAGLFLIDPSSVLSASSQLGINGIINVDSPVADVTSGVTELPTDALDASTLVQAQCASRTEGTSSLTSAGRNGLPAGPDGYLPSPGFEPAADATHIPVSARDVVDDGQVLRLAMTGLECS